MPRVKIPKSFSLKEICVKFVASNLGNWSAYPFNSICDPEAQSVIFSPFDVLPSVLLVEITKAIASHEFRKWAVLDLIITPQLKHFDFPWLNINHSPSDAFIFYLLNLASLRCPDLKAINLRYMSHYPYPLGTCVHLCALKFEKLQELNISHTYSFDNCFDLLGKYCKNLRELNADFCDQITDAGIRGLCIMGQCKSIEVLSIAHTQISREGIQMALKHLNSLKRLKVTDDDHKKQGCVPVQVIANMLLQDANPKPKFSLNCLCLSEGQCEDYSYRFYEWKPPLPYISGSLGRVASLCPFVTLFSIGLLSGLTDSDLLGLLCLQNVNTLQIYNYDYRRSHMVTFKGGVGPLLKGFGSTLKVLDLNALEEVIFNIPVIIHFCPKLESLDINIPTTMGIKKHVAQNPQIKTEPSVLKNLVKLTITHDKETIKEAKISSEDMLSLLSSPNLSDVSLSGCLYLDSVFKKAYKVHQFHNIVNLKIIGCSLSKKGINVFWNDKNPLTGIEIRDCNISKKDLRLLRRKARLEKWHININGFKYFARD